MPSFGHDTKILVTGANGFAGSHLCRYLVNNTSAMVFALVRDSSNIFNLKDILEKIELVYGDVRYSQIVDQAVAGKDYVFNLAAKVNIAETRQNPSETMRANINGAYNVAAACLRYGIKRLVHVSTCHVYGNVPVDRIPTDETLQPAPVDVYSVSKYAGEMMVNSIAKLNDKFDVIITRAFNHYGPGQTGDYFIAKVIKTLLEGRTPALGSPRPTRDYCHVRDVVKGYVMAAEKGRKGEIYHFASGHEMSIGEIYDQVCKVLHKDVKATWQSERVQDLDRSCGSYEKANLHFDWRPETPLNEGLEDTIAWWRENKATLLT